MVKITAIKTDRPYETTTNNGQYFNVNNLKPYELNKWTVIEHLKVS